MSTTFCRFLPRCVETLEEHFIARCLGATPNACCHGPCHFETSLMNPSRLVSEVIQMECMLSRRW